jgi:F0F1-type ATP synthase gamma subunit
MTSLRQLEERLRAWQSFRGIAGATRTLAAAQSLHWAELVRRTEAHLARCLALCDAYPAARVLPGVPRVLVALGSDLGLCGPFNRAVGERFALERAAGPTTCVAVGERLRAHVGAGVLVLPAPTSFPRVQTLAAELEHLLPAAGPTHTRLSVVLVTGVETDGRPRVEVRDEPEPAPVARRWTSPVAELVAPEQTAAAVAALTRHARIVAALVRSAASESEARWRTMNRAHDAADRRIGEQERELHRRRQELVTQEMLEARQGARAR